MVENKVAKTALVTGVTGQDGAYLSELLLEKGYDVVGLRRRSSSFNTWRVEHLYSDPHETSGRGIRFDYGDLTDSTNIVRILQTYQPDEIYNLAAQSHVAVSFETPEANADGIGTLRLLEAIRILGLQKRRSFIKPLLRSFMVRRWRRHKLKVPLFARVRLMPRQKKAYAGSRSITARLMMCLLATEFFLTTKVRSEGRTLSLARSRALWRLFISVTRVAFISVIWTPSVIGVMQETTLTECGVCCSKTSLGTLC